MILKEKRLWPSGRMETGQADARYTPSPGTISSIPVYSRILMASRTGTRLTPNSSAMSRSDGSRSPGL